jgi:hypothetical protein
MIVSVETLAVSELFMGNIKLYRISSISARSITGVPGQCASTPNVLRQSPWRRCNRPGSGPYDLDQDGDGKRASGNDQDASIHKTTSVDLAIPQGKLITST